MATAADAGPTTPARAAPSGASPASPLEEEGGAAAALRAAAARIARLDAEVLLAHVLGVERMALMLDLEGPVGGAATAAFATLVDRRAAGEPVAYITGRREFWSLDLCVTPDVLIPRPDSETLIAAAVDYFSAGPASAGPARVLDLGTGSGALLLAALGEWPAARGVGIDASAAALAVAQGNAARLGFGDRAEFVHGGWDAAAGAFDLVLCNPPYIADGEVLPRDVAGWEPLAALFAGPDGLADIRRVAPVVAARLAAGGVVCIEIGATQAGAAGALFAAAGLGVALRRDLAGLPRCLVVTK